MPTIEINISGQKYLLKSEEDEQHSREVAELVRRRIESIRKKAPTITLQKAAILAAFEFASASIKGRRKALDYRANVLSKANKLLENMTAELDSESEVRLS